MSDRSQSGPARHRRTLRAAALFGLMVATLLVGQGLLSALPLDTRGASIPSGLSAWVGATPAKGKVATTPLDSTVLAQVHRLIAHTSGISGAKLRSIPDSTWAAFIAKETGRPSTIHVAFNLGMMVLAGGIGAGLGFVVGVAICAAVTFGACVLALAAVGAVAVILGYVLGSYGVNVSDGLLIWSKSMYNAFASGVGTAEVGLANSINLLNATESALGYAASNAALNQLGNSSFNPYQDLNDSGIASQLSTVTYAEQITEGSWSEGMMNFYQTSMGASGGFGSTGQACPLYFTSTGYSEDIASAGGVYPADLSGSVGSDPQCFAGLTVNNQWNGYVVPSSTYALPTRAWVSHLSQLSYKDAAHSPTVLTFRPLGPTGIWYNVTLHSGNMTPFVGVTGVYRVSASTAVVSLGMGNAFPLDTAAAATSAVQPRLWVNESDSPTVVGDIAGYLPSLAHAGCGASSCPSFTLFGQNGAAVNQYPYVQAVAQAAVNTASVYWTALRNLGYTDVSQVPSKCLIPSPTAAFSGFTTTELAGMDTTTLYRLYYAWLADLGFTFNASSTITVLNVCGKHLTAPVSYPYLNSTINATGSIYVPNATSEPAYTHSHGVEYFNETPSWNLTGLQIFISPTVNTVNLTVNTSWLAPRKNPVDIFYLTNAGTNKSVLYLLAHVTGNSTNLSGSTFPNQKTTGSLKGYSVYLSTCFNSTGTKSFDVVCSFQHATIASKGATGPCDNGAIGAGCSAATGSLGLVACGQNIPILGPLAGFVASAVGFGALGCLVGWVVAVILILLVVVGIAYAAVAIVGGGRRQR